MAEIMVNMTKEPTAELAVTGGGGLRLSAVTIPLVGETPTGGERTKFLPRPSKDLSIFISYTNFDPVKLLSADYIQINPYPVPQGWSRTKDTFSDSSQPRTSLQSGAGRAEDGPSHRQDHNGSVYSGLVLVSLINSP